MRFLMQILYIPQSLFNLSVPCLEVPKQRTRQVFYQQTQYRRIWHNCKTWMNKNWCKCILLFLSMYVFQNKIKSILILKNIISSPLCMHACHTHAILVTTTFLYDSRFLKWNLAILGAMFAATLNIMTSKTLVHK